MWMQYNCFEEVEATECTNLVKSLEVVLITFFTLDLDSSFLDLVKLKLAGKPLRR